MTEQRGTATDQEEKPTPPVPPTGTRVVERAGSHRVLDRDRCEASCPQCGGPTYLIERTTGALVIGHWYDLDLDEDEYQLTDEWEQIERVQECDHCGWAIHL